MKPTDKAITQFIHTVIRQAGKSLRRNFGVITTGKTKTSEHDIVTEADYEAERIILTAIQKTFPTHSILSEEAGHLPQHSSDYTWVIDPLDGTNNFARRIPLFGVIMALTKGDTVLHGAIYDPIHDELFYSQKGHGSYCNGQRLHVHKPTSLAQTIVNITNIPGRSSITQFANWRKRLALSTTYYKAFGSAAQATAALAAGRIDAYIMAGAYPWDIAAGALLIQEAGGKVTTLTNQPWQWSTPNQQVLAAHPATHRQLLKLCN